MPTMKEKARISFRTDARLKEEATKVLSDMQLDLSTAFNLFLDQVVKQNKLPFEVTNETVQERELREIREKVAHGVAEAHAGEGTEANDFLADLKEKKAKLLHGQL